MPLTDLNKISMSLVRDKATIIDFISIGLCFVDERLDVVEIFVDDSEVRRTLRNETLNKIDDLPKLMRSFMKKRATLQVKCYLLRILSLSAVCINNLFFKEVFKVYQTITQIPQIKRLLSKIEKKSLVIDSMFVQPFDVRQTHFLFALASNGNKQII